MKSLIRTILATTLLVFSVPSFALVTYEWQAGLGVLGNLWNLGTNWEQQDGSSGVPNSNISVAALTTFGTGTATTIDLLGISPTIRGLEITDEGFGVGSGTLIFAGSGNPTPYIILYTTGSSWGQATVIESNLTLDASSGLTINVGPESGTNQELILSGSITGGGPISKTGVGELILKGTTIDSNIDIAQGNLVFSGPTSYSNVISGAGNFILGSGNLTLTAAQTYTGTTTTTTLNSPTLTLSGSGSISESRSVTIQSGTILIITSGAGGKTIQTPSGEGSINLNDNTLTINSSSDSTYLGVISGTGGLTKTGSNSLTLSSMSTYTGATTISTGTLILQNTASIEASSGVEVNGSLTLQGNQTIQDLSGSGNIDLEANTLTISQGGSTFSGIISNGGNVNGGSIVKSGSGTSILSGNNTFTGSVTLSGGGLTLSGSNAYTGQTSISSGATLTLSSSGNIANSTSVVNNGTLAVNTSSGTPTIQNLSGSGALTVGGNGAILSQSSSSNFSGAFSGSANLTKSGTGTLTLSGTSSTYSGTTTVSQGILSVTGLLGGNLTISTGGTLQGTGTVTSTGDLLSNSGIVQPGTSIGTLNVAGDYTQNSDGTLVIELNSDGTTDLLNVTGTATLNGQLTISPLPGLYHENDIFTIITAGSVDDFFSTMVELKEISGVLTYNAGSVTYTLARHSPILPVVKSPTAINGLRGNALNIANYLFRPGVAPQNNDLALIYGTILRLPASQFSGALQTLAPNQFGALPLVSLQSDVRMAGGFVQNLKNLSFCNFCNGDCSESENTLWVEPLVYDYIQFTYEQHGLIEQTKFNAITYGVNSGYAHLTENHLCFGFDLAYTHTNLHWSREAGNGKWSSVYFGPGLGWRLNEEKTYLDCILLGIVNFYDIERKIVFPGIERVAKNLHTGFDILARLDGGTTFNWKKFFIQPEGIFNCLTVFEPEYSENGADSLNLTVDSKYDVYIRPEVTLRTGFEFNRKKVCIQPSLKLGWVANIPLTYGIYHARLRNETFPTQNQFPTLSFHRTTNQLVAGVGFSMEASGFYLNAGFEANYLDKSIIQEAKFRFEWWF